MEQNWINFGEVILEWGNQARTSDPFGARKSVVSVGIRDLRVQEVSFSHSVIEITAEGKLLLPDSRASAGLR